ncbi:EAL domain-containing protein [Nitrosomonas aestuarii]|nr:EAL domain-containing protein [Nitrosomonas aestuarii]
MGFEPLCVSVNLSSRQFRSESLVNTVSSALADSGLEPRYLELELTESLLADNTEHAISLMHALKELGIALSIDDFDTGYSSLSYLKRFPIDCLKIDRSFITDIASNAKDAAIVEAISALAHNLGIGLVAEGVENINQAKLLEGYGCTEMQGYFYSEPIDANHLVSILNQLGSSTLSTKVAKLIH